MKDLTLETLVAVFQEMFGIAWWWAIVIVSAIGALAFLFVLIRDRGVLSKRFVKAELLAPVGGIGAVAFTKYFTDSSFGSLFGGPIDWIVVVGVFALGAGGAVVISYVLLGLLFPERREAA
jgi:hypothetical protein